VEGSTNYDEVPYLRQAYAQTHPDRLATLARVFGLAPADVTACRVLELGCASGGNLIPMACRLPGSEFVGIDLSERQIEQGRAVLRELALPNIRLERASILDVDASWGQFDYVVCHGVYSWVDRPVQDKILEIAARRTGENGLAYVSYNTYPGWHMREMIRHMMRYHAGQFDSAEQQIAQARALLDFLAASVPPAAGAYGQLLHGELDLLRRCADAYLYHEHLEPTNSPIYFHQFVERARAAGLQYLAEAELAAMLTGRFAPEVAETLERISPDILHLEQYMDFVRNRLFRQTILCHRGQRVSRALRPAVLDGMFIACGAHPERSDGAAPGAKQRFALPGKGSIETDAAATKAALAMLIAAWPRCIEFGELRAAALAQAREHLAPEAMPESERRLIEDLFQCFLSGLVELHTAQPNCTSRPSERPRADAYAAWLAARNEQVVNARHENASLDAMGRRMLALLDGTVERAEIAGVLQRAGDASGAHPHESPPDRPDRQRPDEAAIDRAITALARNALLVA
jgi:methyltransferase-like protein/2-polyprenyl-3-methyl-5-hydroxy-6-metoxy-1,4-benzoquinol methylase